MSAPIIEYGYDIASPSTSPTVIAGTASGSLGGGNYTYAITYVTNFGETTVGPSISPFHDRMERALNNPALIISKISL